jgi:hypothetical protein
MLRQESSYPLDSVRPSCVVSRRFFHELVKKSSEVCRNNRSSPVVLIQNTLDTYHYACDFNPIREALGGLLREDQPPVVALTRG